MSYVLCEFRGGMFDGGSRCLRDPGDRVTIDLYWRMAGGNAELWSELESDYPPPAAQVWLGRYVFRDTRPDANGDVYLYDFERMVDGA